MNPDQTLRKVGDLLSRASFILDIGAGKTHPHTSWFISQTHHVETCDFYKWATYYGDFNQVQIESNRFDCVWASHVLEHQLNVNMFLKKCHRVLKKDGIIAVTVPPRTTYTAGGHVTQWNPGMLIYNLVLAGFDCSNAHIKQYGYNQSVIAYKGSFELPSLNYDTGDLGKLNKWLPKGLKYEKYGNFEGDIQEHNW